jgi:hypothetical protein
MPEPIFMKFGMYFMESEPISTAYFIHPSQQSVSICISSLIVRQRLGKNPPTVARQRLVKNVTGTTNIQSRTEEMLVEVSHPLRFVSSE